MATRKEASKLKAEFIAKREQLLRGKISEAQLQLYDQIIDKYLKILEKERSTANTLKVISEMEKTVKDISVTTNASILKNYAAAAKDLGNLNMMYFATMFDDDAKLDLIRQKTDEVMNKRLGLNEDGSLKKTGFINKMITSSSMQRDIIGQVRKAIAGDYDLQKLKESFRRIIVGAPGQAGAFERHYNTFAKDLLSRIDNANGNIFRKELGLKHAIYSGGLIGTSRILCIRNNGKIFSEAQIEALRNDPFIKKMYEKNPGEYDPFEQPGGYGCLHSWDWITDDLAEDKTEQNKKAAERNRAFKKRNGL